MFKPQMKFQKALFIAVLILAAITFFYSLGITTDLYPLYLLKAYRVDGYQVFEDIQGYNKQIVGFALGLILISLLPFIFASSSRRKYYLGNYVATGVQSVSFIACSIFMMVQTAYYRNRFLTEVDLEKYAEKCADKGYYFSGTTIWFDLGFVVGALLIVAALVIVGNLVWKVLLMREEKKLLEGGAIHE